MANSTGRVLSVNVGTAREFEYGGRPARSALWKSPVAGRIAVRGVNLAGDDQADRTAHGGPDKVVYAYAVEDARWWQQQVGRSLEYGEVSEPRIPCWRLGVRMNDKMFPRQFTEALQPGTYLRLIVEGSLGAGDEIRVVERPAHDLTIRDVFRIYTRDRHEVQRLLTVLRMSESWKRWAVDWLQKSKSQPTQVVEPGCCDNQHDRKGVNHESERSG